MSQRKRQAKNLSANPRNRVSHLRITSAVRSKASSWSLFGDARIHKVFVWDRQGTYIDCQFPNPIHGHFFGGPTLRGKNVHEVLPAGAADVIHKGIALVLQIREPWKGEFEINAAGKSFYSQIYFLPVGEVVLGLVTDSLLPEVRPLNPPSPDTDPETISEDFHLCLSSKEKGIVREVKRGLTNREIAKSLQIAERTVKFHLANIYRKLRVSSRVQMINWSPIRNSSDPLSDEDSLQSGANALSR